VTLCILGATGLNSAEEKRSTGSRYANCTRWWPHDIDFKDLKMQRERDWYAMMIEEKRDDMSK